MADIPCAHCEEPIRPGDELARYAIGVVRQVDGKMICTTGIQHVECAVRSAVGGINHQLGKCSCCPGGTEPPDPPELTPRKAAEVAYRHWLSTRGHVT